MAHTATRGVSIVTEWAFVSSVALFLRVALAEPLTLGQSVRLLPYVGSRPDSWRPPAVGYT
jgi:hypothetical protein